MNARVKRTSVRVALARLPGTTLVRTYVWEKPVRIAHWLIFFSFAALSFTGLYIDRPFLMPSSEGSLLMARMRFVHEVSGFVLIAAMALRIYWFFKGNFWARWSAYVPLRREQWEGVGTMLQFYLFMRFLPRAVVGHNPLAALAYLVIYILFLVEILTGLFLFARVLGNPTLLQAVGWMGVMVNPSYIRLTHYFLTFVFFAFVLFHVYASVLVSLEEENGLLDSIFSGWKFIPARELQHELGTIPDARRFVRRHRLLPQDAPPKSPGAAAVRPVVATGPRPGPGPVTLFHNWISYVGATIAAIGLLVFVVLTAYHTIGGGTMLQPYGDLVMFFVPPIFVIVGVVLVLIGLYVQWLRWRTYMPLRYGRYPKWDLNVSRERTALLMTALAGGLLIVPATYGTGQAYHYSETLPFCGTVCHAMEPEYVTYLNSPHARVECSACHIAPGIGGWVHAKARGMVELYAVMTDHYPRPIPTTDMAKRPARVNCERCHWPGNRVTARRLHRMYFLADEANTAWELDMAILIDGGAAGAAATTSSSPAGGGTTTGGRRVGAHWHVDATVEYVTSSDGSVPWVRAVDPTTRASTVYAIDGQSTASAPAGQIHRMDCVDCHSRPSHRITPPDESLDTLLAEGRIDASLPYIKQRGIAALAAGYASRDQALPAIDQAIRGYYQQTYPQLYSSRQPVIAAASTSLQEAYRRTFFPDMKVQWDTYPSNDSHLNSPGCMRCHDGQHRSTSGQVIRAECGTCHQIQRQGPRGNVRYATTATGLEFEHPVDIGDTWKTSLCSECHTGGRK